MQQQSNDREQKQFNYKGELVIDKVKPTPDGLADCKDVQRDCNYLFSLFSPTRYDCPTYPIDKGYDIGKLKDRYREFSLLLNRDGTGNVDCDLYFRGEINHFEELPGAQSINYQDYIN